MSAHRWHLVSPDNTVRCTITAPDRASAEAVLRPVGQQAVVSALSYACGLSKAVRATLAHAPRLCGLCVKPLPADRNADGMHAGCRARFQRGYVARRERADVERRRQARQRQREGPIRRGIATRRQRRESSG